MSTKDPFSIILTSVGVELLSFRKKTGKITNDEEEHLTSAIVERVVRKLKEHGCYQLATDGRLEGYIQEKDNTIGKLRQEIEGLKATDGREDKSKCYSENGQCQNSLVCNQDDQCMYVTRKSGREELEKENEITVSQLRETVKELQKENINYKNYTLKAIGYKDQITSLQSSLKEKEKANKMLNGVIESQVQQINKLYETEESQSKQIEELKAENERLKELLSRLEDYFDDRADTIDGEVPTPNKEMSFLSEIRDLI